jgi:Ca2+/H+ antiporter
MKMLRVKNRKKMLSVSFALSVICVAFVELFIFLNMVTRARAILACSQQSIAVIKAKDLTDDEKEEKIRRSTLESLKLTLTFAALFLSLCAALFGLYFVFSHLLALSNEQVVTTLSSTEGLIGLTVVALLYIWARNAIQKLRSA